MSHIVLREHARPSDLIPLAAWNLAVFGVPTIYDNFAINDCFDNRLHELFVTITVCVRSIERFLDQLIDRDPRRQWAINART